MVWEGEDSTESKGDFSHDSGKKRFLKGQSDSCESSIQITWLGKFTFSVSHIIKEWDKSR